MPHREAHRRRCDVRREHRRLPAGSLRLERAKHRMVVHGRAGRRLEKPRIGGLRRIDGQVVYPGGRQRLASKDLLAAQDDAELGVDEHVDAVEQMVVANVGPHRHCPRRGCHAVGRPGPGRR